MQDVPSKMWIDPREEKKAHLNTGTLLFLALSPAGEANDSLSAAESSPYNPANLSQTKRPQTAPDHCQTPSPSAAAFQIVDG